MKHLFIGLLIGSLFMISLDAFSMSFEEVIQMEQLTVLRNIENNMNNNNIIHIVPVNTVKLSKEEIRFNECMSKQKGTIYTLMKEKCSN